LVASIVIIGAVRISYQQAESDRQGPRITSANIVDGEVKSQDLAPNSVTSDKIKNDEVKEEDPTLDTARRRKRPSFSLQATERSNSVTVPTAMGSGFIRLAYNAFQTNN
jgi:hypothetical protein